MSELNINIAQEALEKFNVEKVFQTRDGQVFLSKNRADLHARSVGGKVTVVSNDFVISNNGTGYENDDIESPGDLDSEDSEDSEDEDLDFEGMEASEDNSEEEEDLEAILSHPAKEVIEIVSVLGNLSLLGALHEAESLGKKRVTVLQAIKDVIELLTTDQRA